MAATATIAKSPIPRPGSRYDHVFFAAVALIILATVALGFARTYYLAGVFRAPLPAPIIHVHGAAFSLWILLLITQTSLVSARRVDLHRKLGVAGFLLATLMVVLGALAATNSLHRNFAPPGIDPQTFYIIPLGDMAIFSTLIFFAWRMRRDPAAHKRLILIATTALLIAAVARWPFAFTFLQPLHAQLITYLLLIALVAYDFFSLGKIHRATLWASLFLVVMQFIRVPIGQSAAWHAFAGWVQGLR